MTADPTYEEYLADMERAHIAEQERLHDIELARLEEERVTALYLDSNYDGQGRSGPESTVAAMQMLVLLMGVGVLAAAAVAVVVWLL